MGEFNIKHATKCTLKAINSDECIEIDYLSDSELTTEDDNDICTVGGEDVVIEVDTDELKKSFVFDDSTTLSCDMEFALENVNYNITINNILGKYIERCPEIVAEYCYNIIHKLVKEGHEFINGEVIDFQKYLV